MASQNIGEHQMGTMDIREHRETWKGFMALVKWGTGATAVILILMALFLL
ncbi:MAG TPA: aa3-type cytochrome c oxidase subunit IV [Ferrovibrio sp.]